MTFPGDETPFAGRPPPARDMGADLGAAEPEPVTEAMIYPHTSSNRAPSPDDPDGFVCHICQTANPARASYCLQCGVRHQRSSPPPAADQPPPSSSAYPPPPSSTYPPPEEGGWAAGDEPTGEWDGGEWDLDFSQYDRPSPGEDGAAPPGGEGGGPLPPMPGEEPPRPGPAYGPYFWRRAIILFVVGTAVILAALTLFRSGNEPEPVPSTTTLPAAEETALRQYTGGLRLLAEEVAAVGASAAQVNRAWDDRIQNYDVTRSGLISIQLQAEDLPNQLEALDPPAELTLDNRLRLEDSLRVMADSAAGMVTGLESPDTGEARSRALERFNAAVAEFGWVSEAVIETLEETLSSPAEAAAENG